MVSRALKAHDLETSAPDGMRTRVAASLATEDRPATPRRSGVGRVMRSLPWVAAAAVAGLMFGLSWPSASEEGTYAQDFLSRAVEADAVDHPDVQAVTAFFMRELGVPVPPVVLATSPMSRAMICLIDGERAAMVEYETDGYTLAHYRVPLKDGRMPSGGSPSVVEEDGVCVVRWADERFEHALVSDMPEDRLISLAETDFAASSP